VLRWILDERFTPPQNIPILGVRCVVCTAFCYVKFCSAVLLSLRVALLFWFWMDFVCTFCLHWLFWYSGITVPYRCFVLLPSLIRSASWVNYQSPASTRFWCSVLSPTVIPNSYPVIYSARITGLFPRLFILLPRLLPNVATFPGQLDSLVAFLRLTPVLPGSSPARITAFCALPLFWLFLFFYWHLVCLTLPVLILVVVTFCVARCLRFNHHPPVCCTFCFLRWFLITGFVFCWVAIHCVACAY